MTNLGQIVKAAGSYE